jgi:hypothetical protein
VADPCTAGDLAHGECSDALLFDDVDGGTKDRGAEGSIVLAGAHR